MKKLIFSILISAVLLGLAEQFGRCVIPAIVVAGIASILGMIVCIMQTIQHSWWDEKDPINNYWFPTALIGAGVWLVTVVSVGVGFLPENKIEPFFYGSIPLIFPIIGNTFGLIVSSIKDTIRDLCW